MYSWTLVVAMFIGAVLVVVMLVVVLVVVMLVVVLVVGDDVSAKRRNKSKACKPFQRVTQPLEKVK